LIFKVYLLENNTYPVIKNINNNFYKLYLHDVGLLRYISQIHPSKIINDENFDWIGYLVENFVIQQLKPTILNKSYYFKINNNFEIDFLTQIINDVIPFEIKSGKSKKKKSLTLYNEKYKPKYSIRISKMGFKKDGLIINVPLWMINFVDFTNISNELESKNI
jgi:predicted AAA+ superfamily ATPase